LLLGHARPTRENALMDGPTNLVRQPAQAAENSSAPQREAPARHSPARAQLALAIADLARAGVELTAAQEPATRLGAVIAEAARLEAEMAVQRAAHDARLGAWLAEGAADPRPEPGPAAIAFEKRCEALTADAIAARAALPAAERSFQDCAARVREMQHRRDTALCGAAIDAARVFAEGYRAALTVALEHQAVLHGLREELLARGNRSAPEPGAMDAAARIGELIAETKRGAAVRHNPEAARRLLTALLSDPDASI
jgi:hypothetical protein